MSFLPVGKSFLTVTKDLHCLYGRYSPKVLSRGTELRATWLQSDPPNYTNIDVCVCNERVSEIDRYMHTHTHLHTHSHIHTLKDIHVYNIYKYTYSVLVCACVDKII